MASNVIFTNDDPLENYYIVRTKMRGLGIWDDVEMNCPQDDCSIGKANADLSQDMY